MSKKRTHFICRGCKKPFPNPNSRKAHCSLSCAVWHKIDKRGPDECWEWQGARTGFGYGSLRYESAHYYAHKVAYADAKGEPFPEGLEGCHSCDNPKCCNPAHIFPGTHLDNMRDMDAKGRRRTVAHKGERCGASRLKEYQVLAIRAEYRPGIGYRTLAAKYGCGATTVARIVRRTHWRHI